MFSIFLKRFLLETCRGLANPNKAATSCQLHTACGASRRSNRVLEGIYFYPLNGTPHRHRCLPRVYGKRKHTLFGGWVFLGHVFSVFAGNCTRPHPTSLVPFLTKELHDSHDVKWKWKTIVHGSFKMQILARLAYLKRSKLDFFLLLLWQSCQTSRSQKSDGKRCI